MGDKTTIICGKCGKNFEVDSGVSKGFCLFCGARFAKIDETADRTMDGTVDGTGADRLYRERDWQGILQQYGAEPGDVRLRLYRLVAHFYAGCDRYLAEATALEAQTRTRALLSIFTGGNEFARDSIHAAFRDQTQQTIDAIVAEAFGAPAWLTAEIATMLTDTLLGDKPQSQAIYWVMVSCEQMSVTLLPFIPLSELERIYAAYDRVNPKNMALPNQERVRRELTAEIIAKGGALPRKKRLFG